MSTQALAATPPPHPLRQDAAVIGLVGLAHGVSHFSQLLLPPLFKQAEGKRLWARQRAGLPVHRLLGGARESAPVMVVAPYALPDEDDADCIGADCCGADGGGADC